MRGFSVLLHLKPIFDFSEPEKNVFNNLHNNKKILKLTVHKKKKIGHLLYKGSFIRSISRYHII